MQSTWNSLEIIKLIVQAVTPIAVVAIGWRISRSLKRVEHADWLNRTLIERRMALHDRMAPLLNDLLAFSRLFGRFREISPPKALCLKRALDKEFALERHLFSPRLEPHYVAFMDALFQTYRPGGGPAQLRLSLSRQRHERGAAWDDAWNDPLRTGADAARCPRLLRQAAERPPGDTDRATLQRADGGVRDGDGRRRGRLGCDARRASARLTGHRVRSPFECKRANDKRSLLRAEA